MIEIKIIITITRINDDDDNNNNNNNNNNNVKQFIAPIFFILKISL